MRLISRALLGLQLLVLALVVVAKAQEQKNPANQATVWASFVYTINGETNSNDVLTSKGADQGRKVGKMVRSRYLDGPESNITSAYRLKSVPKTRLSNAKVEIMSTEKEGNIGMATMFMKGLYPQKKDNNSDEVYPVIKALRDNDVDHFE